MISSSSAYSSLGNKDVSEMICRLIVIFVWIFPILQPLGNVFIWDFVLLFLVFNLLPSFVLELGCFITVTQCYIYAKSDSKRLMTSAVAITPEISLLPCAIFTWVLYIDSSRLCCLLECIRCFN